MRKKLHEKEKGQSVDYPSEQKPYGFHLTQGQLPLQNSYFFGNGKLGAHHFFFSVS
jgi:hypothetical protein